ncbi:hypothetical protein ACUYGA_06875 [Metapseudomonas otitidis]|uniref:hypothetical protein n=1 Tax=Metapseudomonas otitidis TaxID=319939 RepID=UPI0040553F6C
MICVTREHLPGLELAQQQLSITSPLVAEQLGHLLNMSRDATPAEGTTSDKYRAELYDELWQRARDMGYGNVTDALVELERMKTAPPAADGSEPAEVLAARLISERAAVLGHPVPWAQAIEITATITKMPDEEKAALLALDDSPPAAGVPEGWRLVPIEPTTGMLLKCHLAGSVARRVWKDLLAAAPTPPASEQQRAVVVPEKQVEYVGDRDHKLWASGANWMLREFLRLNPHLANSEGV